MSKFLKLFVVALLLVSCSKKDENQVVNTNELTIVSQDGAKTSFFVEEAVTKEQLTKGLMGRESLPEKNGMIFNLGGFTNIAMWMKDTKIPLDMIFEVVFLPICIILVPVSAC